MKESTCKYFILTNMGARWSNLLFLLDVIAPFFAISDASWAYDGNADPDHWLEMEPKCGGAKQSPINIESEFCKFLPPTEALYLVNYDKEESFLPIENNGHTAKIKLRGNQLIRGEGLRGSYVADQIHFHWGSDNGQGSEHSINGVFYAMEMHIVHYNDKYGSIRNALQYPDGLVVLAFLFKTTAVTHNLNYENIVSSLSEIIQPHTSTKVGPIILAKLLPKTITEYYTYKGSLTTLPCDESVTWLVFPNVIMIGEAQMARFRLLHERKVTNEIYFLVDNFRPVQPLNNRVVYRNSPQLHNSLNLQVITNPAQDTQIMIQEDPVRYISLDQFSRFRQMRELLTHRIFNFW